MALTELTRFQRFRRGLGFIPRGAGFLIRRPRLFPWVIGPALLTLAMVVWAWFASWSWTPWLLGLLWPRPVAPGFIQYLWNGTAFFLIIWGFATAAILIFGLLGAFGAPFYDRLSMAVEHEINPSAPALTWQEEFRAVALSVGHASMAVVLWIVALGALVLLSVIPVLGTLLEMAASLTVTAFFMARAMLDGPMSRRGYSFRDKVGFIRERPLMMFGFGLGATALLIIPFVNVFTIPIAIVGGTLLFDALERPPDGEP